MARTAGKTKAVSKKPKARGKAPSKPKCHPLFSAPPRRGVKASELVGMTPTDLVKYYRTYAVAMAHNMHAQCNKIHPLDDLVSEAYMGLFTAAKKYDPTKGQTFETYSRHRINGAMLDWIRAQQIVPRWVRDRRKKYERALAKLTDSLGREPSDNELTAELEISLIDLENIKALRNEIFLVFERPFEPGHAPEHERAFPITTEDHVHSIEISRNEKEIIRAINALPSRQKMLFAMLSFERLTLREAGQIFDYSTSTMRQLKEQIMYSVQDIVAERVAEAGMDLETVRKTLSEDFEEPDAESNDLQACDELRCVG